MLANGLCHVLCRLTRGLAGLSRSSRCRAPLPRRRSDCLVLPCLPATRATVSSPSNGLLQLQEKKKKYEPPAPPPRVGKKQRRRDASSSLGTKLPAITPSAKCKLRLLKLERVKDWLLMEEEFVSNQERQKPADERNEEERTKVDDLRGTPLSVGTLEEMIDENHAIVSSAGACFFGGGVAEKQWGVHEHLQRCSDNSGRGAEGQNQPSTLCRGWVTLQPACVPSPDAVGPEYYVTIMSFVDKMQLEPGSTVLLHNKVWLLPLGRQAAASSVLRARKAG